MSIDVSGVTKKYGDFYALDDVSVSLPTGQLTARLRLQQAAESRREQRASSLYRLTRELANTTDFPELLNTAARELSPHSVIATSMFG